MASWILRGMLAILLHIVATLPAQAFEPKFPETKSTCRFEPIGDQSEIPERYRLNSLTFEAHLQHRFELRQSGVDVFDLTFPSPIISGIVQNDTVHAEYFIPQGLRSNEKIPGVIVLDILDGKGIVSRAEAVWLAQNRVAALFVYMSHYGPRRENGSKVRMLSPNIERSMAAVRQTVLDCRCATAWLATRPEIDAQRLGLVGTSLGSLIGANVAAAEPRLKNVCLVLPAGGLVDAFYDHPRAKPYLPLIPLLGGKEKLKNIIAPADPITYSAQLKQKNLLIIAAQRDDILPPSAAKALWNATGKQQIIWFDSTHVGAAIYVVPVLQAITSHLKQ